MQQQPQYISVKTGQKKKKVIDKQMQQNEWPPALK